MDITREQAHQLVDALFDELDTTDKESKEPVEAEVIEEPKRELPKDKRLVYTKSSGDRKYQLDEVKKIRQWITNPQVLEQLGWKMEDAVEIDDSEMLRYQMGSAIYRVDNATKS